MFTQEDSELRLAICLRPLSKRGKEGPEPKCKGHPIKISTLRPCQITGQHEMNPSIKGREGQRQDMNARYGKSNDKERKYQLFSDPEKMMLFIVENPGRKHLEGTQKGVLSVYVAIL